MSQHIPQVYFQPNQFAMRVLHKDATLGPDAVKEYWHWIEQAAGRQFNGRIVTTGPLDDGKPHQFTCAAPKLQSEFITFAYRRMDGLEPHELPLLAYEINRSDARPTDKGGQSGRLDLVDMNWLSCAGDWAGDGGPGGEPQPFVPDPSGEIPYRFDGPLMQSLRARGNEGQGIAVVIFDTAPLATDIQAAYDERVLGQNGELQHPLLRDLWAAKNDTPALTIVPMNQATTDRLKPYRLEHHRYPVRDHGLFIAGIIKSIAPQAELFLYEALNKDGVCDSASILDGFDWIRTDPRLQGKRLVINCSLFLVIPYRDGHFDGELDTYFPADPWNTLQPVRDWLKTQGRFSEPFFQAFDTADSQVMAAAGNDWRRDAKSKPPRPFPRFPAAFDSVQGVAAFEEGANGIPASYSDYDEDPKNTGISAFGGGLVPKDGVLGTYISPFTLKSDATNHNGWARWAGTSFATPVVSGVVAAMMSDPLFKYPAGVVVDALRQFCTIRTGSDNVLPIYQG